MKAKTLKLKYPNNPGALLDKLEVVDYNILTIISI